MKAFYMMFVVFAVLLLGAPLASPQDGSPSCSGGSAYDLTGHGCVTGYTNGSAAAAAIAPKVAGRAAMARAEQQDPTMDWISSQERNANLAAAGLAKVVPAVDPKQGLPDCPWEYYYNPITHDYVLVCLSQPADNAAALKPAGLAKIAPVEKFDPSGFSEQFDPLLDPLALVCLSQPGTAAKAASKPAGLAAPAPMVDLALSSGCLSYAVGGRSKWR